MNKYAACSKIAESRRVMARVIGCLSKRAYETYDEAAEHKGMQPYRCRHCGKFHRATKGGWSWGYRAIQKRKKCKQKESL